MRTHFGSIRRQSEVCVICRRRQATTKEHIPPQALFRVNPREYLTVPACDYCNNSTKLDDEYLEQVMSSSSLIEEGIQVYFEKVAPKLRSHPKTKAGLRNQLSSNDVEVPKHGRVLFPIIKINPDRMRISLCKIVAALYWFYTGELLPKDTEFEIGFLNVADLPGYFSNQEILKIFKTTHLGIYRKKEATGTFSYTWLITPTYSLWYFFFFRQNAFVVFASEPAR